MEIFHLNIDVMALDSRYPLIAENLDGSVLAMLHSVIQTIEVKTNLTSTDVKQVALLQRTFTSLVHAHAGRTKAINSDRKKRVALF